MGSPTPLKKNSSPWQASEAELHGGDPPHPLPVLCSLLPRDREEQRHTASPVALLQCGTKGRL